MLFSIQRNFPRLTQVKISSSPKAFEGFIDISGRDYYIHLETPCFPMAKNITLKGDEPLLEIMKNSNFENVKFEDNCTVLQYLKVLQSTCDKFVSENSSGPSLNLDKDDYSHFKLLLSHIEELGWEKVCHIAPDFSSIELEHRDEKDRTHKLHVNIPPSYLSKPPTCEADLPTEFNPNFKSNKSLSSIYESWLNCLQSLQPFWNVLDDLDEIAFVIDPTNPSRKHTTRRIILENQVSLHLTVSPEHPFSPPKCQLLGPSSLVAPLNDKLLQLYQTWDQSESIVYNLEHILKVPVVKRNSNWKDNSEEDSEMMLDDWNVECAVCYCLHLEDQLPDFTCDHCKKNFHLSCLHDWLRSLPSSRQNAQYIRGECPHCTKAISCKVPA